MHFDLISVNFNNFQIVDHFGPVGTMGGWGVSAFAPLSPLLAMDHRRFQGGGQGGHVPSLQRPDKNEKVAQFTAFCIIKKFSGGMPPDPRNSLICSVFLALAAAGPL